MIFFAHAPFSTLARERSRNPRKTIKKYPSPAAIQRTCKSTNIESLKLDDLQVAADEEDPMSDDPSEISELALSEIQVSGELLAVPYPGPTS